MYIHLNFYVLDCTEFIQGRFKVHNTNLFRPCASWSFPVCPYRVHLQPKGNSLCHACHSQHPTRLPLPHIKRRSNTVLSTAARNWQA